MSGCGTRIVLRGQKPLALCDRCPCFGSLFPPLAALTFAASSIICAFGLASAAPRSPYRHLELCGIALALGQHVMMLFPLFWWLSSHRISQLMLSIFHCFAVFSTVYSYIVQSFCFLLFKEGTTMPVKSPYTSALARRVTWQLTLTATGRQATWVGRCSMQTPRQVVAPPKPCGPKPVALMASNSSFSSAA